MSNSQIESVSLFSGAGGLDIGSELNGVKVRLAIDIDHDSIETLKLNNKSKKKHIIDEDIKNLKPKSIEKELYEQGLRVDWIGRVYAVINLEGEEANQPELLQQSIVIQSLNPISQILVKYGLSDIMFPDIRRVEGTDSYLVILYPETDYVDPGAVITSLLVTGGGAYNDFLIERMQNYLPNVYVEVPDKITLEFKEALVFSLLGVLKLRNEINTLASVTGAEQDHSAGNIFYYNL